MTPTIRHIAVQAATASAKNITNSQVYNFLVAELSRMPDQEVRLVLENAFGINSPHKKLSARRMDIASKLGKHPDTIEVYENRGINSFAAYLAERSILMRANSVPSNSPPAYVQEIEAQAKATRAMTLIGLASHLSLPSHSEDLMKYLEMPRKPYMDAMVHITLLPSSRGSDWYRFHLSYLFQGGRKSFRVAVVLNRADGEQLMANGLVDDYHGLDNPKNVSREIKTIIASSKLIIRNSQTNTQRLLRFREVKTEDTVRRLRSTSKPLVDSCWLLDVTIPEKWQTVDCTYEYLSWISLPIASVAYWYSPTLMYLKKLTLNFSQFPGSEKRDFFLLSFIGQAPGVELTEKNLYILDLNNWIMPGHGLVLGWQDRPI